MRPWWSGWHAPELAAVFITGLVLMTFFYGSDTGLPGYDDFYHAKMAVLMPKIGLIGQFKWLTTTIFADRFVSHHWGFQALMVPFVYAGQWLRGDAMVGAKWAITFFFAVSMVLFDLLLMVQRVRFRWLWLGLYLVLPGQFYGRQVFIRAIAPSLACMFGILLLMFRRRYVWCAVLSAVYVHIYLGAVFYVPVLVGAYFVAGLLGEDGDRVSWKLPVWAILGLAAGVLTHPYLRGMFYFLYVQVFESGLTPDIPVGREWKSYEGKLWELVLTYFGFTLSMLVVAVTARLRMGERLSAKETAMLVVNFAFLTLAFRQRRFIEYWPPFGLLSSAYLLAPLLERAADSARALIREGGLRRLWLMGMAPLLGVLGAGLVLLFVRGRRLGIEPFIAEWRAWALAAACLAWVTLTRNWHQARTTGPMAAGLANLACGAALVALVLAPAWWAFRGATVPAAVLHVPPGAWAVLALAYVLTPGLARRGECADGERGEPEPVAGLLTGLGAILTGGTFGLLLVLGGAGPLVDVQRGTRCNFDLNAVRDMMAYLKSNSAPDSIIFTDDWDVFPVYFYHNDHNRYIVGLDPKFSQTHDPVLWERYVKITQSKSFPVNASVDVVDKQGQAHKQAIVVRLEDIRDQFGAEFVITDPDHTGLAQNLEKLPEFAERVYPPGERKGGHWPPFTVYRIKPAGTGAAPATAPSEESRGKVRSGSGDQDGSPNGT